MKIAGYQSPVAVGCLLSWQQDSGLQSYRHMSHVKKRKKRLHVINISMKITIQFGTN